MSTEIVRHCDLPIGKKGETCGKRVPDDQPVMFSAEAVDYEVDLCEQHRVAFTNAIAPFVAAGSPVRARSGAEVRKALSGKRGVAFTTKQVRSWLQEQGRDVAPSGRLPNELIDEYVAAHS